MRNKPLQEALPFVAVVAAGIAIFFVVRLLLPTGEDALPPFAPILSEPPPPVFSVAVPRPPAPKPVVREADEVVVVAQPISQPIAVPRRTAAAKPAARPKARAASTPKPKPQPQPTPVAQTPAPAPAPAPEPEPEPTRTLAMREAPAPASTGNRSPGREKHNNGPPPGQAQSSPQAPQDMNPTAAEAVLEPHESPGREKHEEGLPPGQAKKED
jgi:hypothetical protein